MNIQQLRQSLKMKWLSYYQKNRLWLVKMRVWGNYNGLRRPSSGFILATLSVLEPEFEQMLAFMTDLNNNPDAIVTALGLNFNPDEELRLTSLDDISAINQSQNELSEEKPVRSLTTTHNIIPQSPAKIQHPETITSDLPQVHKPLPAFAVATKVTLQSSGKIQTSSTSRQNKPISSLALTTTVPSNGKTIALALEVPHHGKVVHKSMLVSHQTAVVSPTKTQPLLTLKVIEKRQQQTVIDLKEDLDMSAIVLPVAPKISPSKTPLEKLQSQNLSSKTQPIPSTNARSLASWIDEFCQGRS